MKKLTKDMQISALSHPEILPRLKEVTARLSGESVNYVLKEVTYGHVLNGLVLLLLDGDAKEQVEMASAAVKRLEAWTQGVEPILKGMQTKGHPLSQLPAAKSEEYGRKRSKNG